MRVMTQSSCWILQLFSPYLLKNCQLALLFVVFIIVGPLASPLLRGAEADDQLDEVTIQLKWYHQFQFAGYYAAIHKGFYEEEGLRVILKEGGPHIHVDHEVISGKADFGVMGSELIQKRAEGKPVTLLAVILQHSTRAIFVRKNSSIQGPADLIGKTIMLNLNEDIEFQSMFRDEGIATDRINIVPKDNSANKKFINGEIDGLNGSIGNQPFIFQQKGVSVSAIRPISYGTDFYGDSLFTSDQLVEEHPERVKKIIRASIRGWYYAMNNSKEIADLILREYTKKKSREHLIYEAEAMRKLILPDLVDIGHINPHRIERIAQIYREHGLIEDDSSLQGLLYSPDSKESKFKRVTLILSFLLTAVFLLGGLLLFINARLKKLVHSKTVDLQESNSILTAIIDTTTDAIFIKDLKGRYLLANGATLKALGKTRQETIGKRDDELFPEASARVILETDAKVMETGVAQLREEKLETAYGDSYWLANKAPYRDPENKVIGLIGISRDITDRKKIEEEKKLLVEQLHQAQKLEAIGTLAGGIAHDFNNVLAAVLGFAELLKEEIPDDAKAEHHVNEIIRAGNRAKFMVSQILAFSRKSMTNEHLPVDVAMLLTEILQLVRASVPTTIEIRKHILARESCILGDSTQIHQIIMNLCTNAVQSMDDELGVLTLVLSEVDLQASDLQAEPDMTPGRYVKIAVKDTGKGLEEDTIQRIFEPYFTTKEVGKGSGLGLSVVLGIVKSHHGMISVESTPGMGATFNVFFPAIKAPSGISYADESDDDVPTGDEHILVVDDEEAIVETTTELLERMGYTVTAMTDSVDALQRVLAAPQKFDLIISDQTMPGITGEHLAVKILASRPDMPIILCTGYSSRIDEKQARRIGVRAFVEKPLDRLKLATVIRESLEKTDKSVPGTVAVDEQI